MIDVNVIVEAPEEVIQAMVDNPDGEFIVKCIQRDATYKGSPSNADGAVANFVYEVREKS